MKIIDIGICVNNIDPKGIGRIRCIRYNDYVGEKEKALTYEEWGDLDPFVASPFLPNNINIIPEIGQSVKVINYNSEKETVNQEYIAGPFTTMFDYNSQSFSQQIENTSYGVAVKRRENIRRPNGEYVEKNAQNIFAKDTDYGIYGKYGSDVIFTENGIEIRGGKLIAKEAANARNRKKLVTQPIYSDKLSKLHLKKFAYKAELKQEQQKTEEFVNSILNTIVEYEIDSLTNPTKINFYVYKVLNPSGELYKTNTFDENTPLIFGLGVTNSPLKLINEDNSITGATYTVNIDEDNDIPLEKRIYIQIRDIINLMSQKTLFSLNGLYSAEDIHPFYFRPTSQFTTITGTTSELQFKKTILNNINVRRIGPSNGLIWSLNSAVQKAKVVESVVSFFNIDRNSKEQTFSSLTSDKIYLLSTDTNQGPKKINFDSLDKYEWTQKNYIEDIDPNTYSLVRGEELVNVLKSIMDLFESHVHNVSTPLVQADPNFIKLKEKINNLENNILNKSIRIN